MAEQTSPATGSAASDARRPFEEIADKVVVTEGTQDSPNCPAAADVVTIEIIEAGVAPKYRTWSLGSLPPYLLPCGLDLDSCVQTMRRGERCKVRCKGDSDTAYVALWLLAHERAEDFLSNGRLVRFILQEGGGWARPAAPSEIVIRYSWCTVPRIRESQAMTHPEADGAAVEVTLAPFEGTAAASVLDRDMLWTRRLLMRAFGPPIVWHRDTSASDEEKFDGPLLRIARAGHVFAAAERGMSFAEALPMVETSLKSLSSIEQPIRSDARETTVRIEEASCLSQEMDFLPGSFAVRVLGDMRTGQIQTVRVGAEIACTIPGLKERGVPEDAVVEYDIELLKIMHLEDVSLLRNGGLMKKVVNPTDGYDRIVEGSTVTAKISAFCGETIVLEETDVNFTAASGDYCVALDEVVLTMTEKEVCEVQCIDTALCKDDKLRIEPPAESELTLRIEVVDVDMVDLQSPDDNVRVRHCYKRKEIGSHFFQAGDWQRALLRYQHMLSILSGIEVWEDEDAKQEGIALRRVAYLNTCMCHLKLESWKTAVEAADAVLKEDPGNVKALFRRGQAKYQLAFHKEAEENFRKCLEHDKDNKEAARMLAKVKQELKSEAKQEKAMLAKMALNIGSENSERKPSQAEPTNQPPIEWEDIPSDSD